MAKELGWPPELIKAADKLQRLQRENAALRAALDRIAEWDEGPVVGPHFSCPANAQLARDVLKQAVNIQLIAEVNALRKDKERLDKLENLLKDGMALPLSGEKVFLERQVLLAIPRGETVRQFLDSVSQ